VLGVLLERLAAGLEGAPTVFRIAATVGLIIIVPAIAGLWYGPLALAFPPFLPTGTVFTISGVLVGWDAITTLVLGVVAMVGLYAFFRVSRLGVAMRAVVDRPELLDLTGESPTAVRRTAWIIGSCFAAVSGLLFANTQQQLDATLLSLLVVQAFGAAVVGVFQSLPLSFAGGLVLGVVQYVSGDLTARHTSLAGLDTNMAFLFLFIGLLVIPRSRLIELGSTTRHLVTQRRSKGSAPRRHGVPALTLLAAVLVPFVVGTHLPSWTAAMAGIPLFLSLGLLVFVSGQISLCQIGFVAIGAATFAHLVASGLPWLLAVPAAGLVVVPVGALIAIPAIRLSGLYLALATLGFGILLAQFFYQKSYMFGGGTSLPTRRPQLFGLESDRGYYYALLLVTVVCVLLVVTIERGRLGRLLRGLADSPLALSSLGVNTAIPRVLVFCISAFLAGVSGALSAGIFGSINKGPYNYVQSLLVLAVLVISGRRTVPAAIIASLAVTLPTAYLSGGSVTDYLQLGFGAAAIAVAVSSGGRLSAKVGAYAQRHEERRIGPAGGRALTPSRSVAART
jgi:ABC-type branched-subunit amino acid transport system permease subunit